MVLDRLAESRRTSIRDGLLTVRNRLASGREWSACRSVVRKHLDVVGIVGAVGVYVYDIG